MKNIIRLAESDLHRIIKESVKRALNEKLRNIDDQLVDSGEYNYNLADYKKAKQPRNREYPKGFYVCVDTDYSLGDTNYYIGTEKDAKMATLSSEGYAKGPYPTYQKALMALKKEQGM